MKKIKVLSFLIIFIFSNILWLIIANAVECRPAWDWNWTTTENCDWPTWKKVFWNIYVQNHTINMLAWSTMWIDLTNNRITFNGLNSKINLINSKIDNTVSTRYYVAVTFTASSWMTTCPAWMSVFYQQTAPTVTAWYNILLDTPTVNTWPTSKYHNVNKVSWTEINPTAWIAGWTFYCWTKGT